LAEDIARENPSGVVDGFMDNWTDDQRRLFNEDWANDDGLYEEIERIDNPEPSENQIGEGSKRKHASDDVLSKRQTRGIFFNQIGETSQRSHV
jgi:hypothetical protein